MTVKISERAYNLIYTLISELSEEWLEFSDEDGGMPKCHFCKQIGIQPGIVEHTDNCLGELAKELINELAHS